MAIEPNGTPLTVSELHALLPDLRVEVAPAIERSAAQFAARIEEAGEDADVTRLVARHLGTLREVSRQYPAAAIRIREVPDGGELRLQNGSFGADDDELSALLASAAGEPRWRLLVSFRIERDAHAHLLQLVERASPAGVTIVSDSSEQALAVGFEIDGQATRVADLVGSCRLAWRQEGSDAECLVEVEGPVPLLERVKTWSAWVQLEGRLRRSGADRVAARATEAPAFRMLELATIADPAAAELLGDTWLSWLDDDEQILGAWQGAVYSLSERIERGAPGQGELRRTAGGGLHFVRGDRRVALPPVPDGSERRVHGILPAGLVLSDTAGTAHATTQLTLVGARGIESGPPLARVRALDVSEPDVFVLAEGRGGLALLQIQPGEGWGHSEARPWHQDELPTDLAVYSTGRIAILAERGSRSTLYLVERANLVYARRIMVPCVAGTIVARSKEALWITGMSAPPGPSRLDLFRVDVSTGTVALVTAELDAKAIECVATDEHMLLATERVAYASHAGGPRAIVELAGDESITGMVAGSPAAVFLSSPRGPLIVLDRRDTTITLPGAGYEPLRHDWLPF